MIRYPIASEDLLALINARNATWISRAEARTKDYAATGDYTGGTEFWGQIKQVYITLQHEKCAYCETKLQGAMLASKVHEVEHYRPKSSVKRWPDRKVEYWKDFPDTWPLGADSEKGYYLLAYHPHNYAIACTRCNSTLKSNYFPVRGKRNVAGGFPEQMRSELPLLCYPIASVDPDDPEDLITFDGPLAQARYPSGPKHERAVTNIAFFQLNHEDLVLRRSEEITNLWDALEIFNSNANQIKKDRAAKKIDSMRSPTHQFSACLNAFYTLYATNYKKAEELADLIFKALPA